MAIDFDQHILNGTRCPGCNGLLNADGSCDICVPIQRMRATQRPRPGKRGPAVESEARRADAQRRRLAVRKDRTGSRQELPPGDRE